MRLDAGMGRSVAMRRTGNHRRCGTPTPQGLLADHVVGQHTRQSGHRRPDTVQPSTNPFVLLAMRAGAVARRPLPDAILVHRPASTRTDFSPHLPRSTGHTAGAGTKQWGQIRLGGSDYRIRRPRAVGFLGYQLAPAYRRCAARGCAGPPQARSDPTDQPNASSIDRHCRRAVDWLADVRRTGQGVFWVGVPAEKYAVSLQQLAIADVEEEGHKSRQPEAPRIHELKRFLN